MRDELDRALDVKPDYPPGFDVRELEDSIGDDFLEDEDWQGNDQIPRRQIPVKTQ